MRTSQAVGMKHIGCIENTDLSEYIGVWRNLTAHLYSPGVPCMWASKVSIILED